MTLIIREECETDHTAIQTINDEAFGSDVESRLIQALRADGSALISLVAEDKGRVVGHIVFSPVTMEPSSTVKIAGLGPMSVTPQLQRSGIGSQLVKRGLDICQERGYEAAVVLGHPDYYPKFGFKPASTFRIKSTYNVPDDVFMAMELREGALQTVQGTAHYHKAFALF